MIRNITITLLALLATLLGVAPASAAETRGPIPGADDVIAVDYGQVTDYMWENLRELGYTGVQGDEAERLYVPRDVAVEACGGDRDCQLGEDAPATGLERDNVEERAALGGCEQAGLRTAEDLSCVRA